MSHRPKLRALEAFAEDLLSPEAEAILERHLAHCETCQEALASIQAYAEVRDHALEDQPEIDWSKVEFALRREARDIAQSKRPEWLSIAAIAAAVALAVGLGWKNYFAEPEPSTAGDAQEALANLAAPDPEAPVPPAAQGTPTPRIAIAGSLLAQVGQTLIDDQGVLAGAELSEGSQLRLVGAGAMAHLRFAQGTGFTLANDGASVRLEKAHSGELALRLQHGRITNRVRSGTSYTVHSGDYEVRVRGTFFQVENHGEGVSVRLDEGRVDILKDGELLEALTAPARWASSPELLPNDEAISATDAPFGLASDEESFGNTSLATLTLPAQSDIERWQLGEHVFAAAGELSLRLPVATHEIVAWDQAGQSRRFELLLPTDGHRVSERELPRRRARVGSLRADEIQPVIQSRIRNLRRCYERQLRRGNPELAARFRLRVTVGTDGRVRRVNISSEHEAPPPLLQCFHREASGWQFPEPRGGPATFDLPLDLSPNR